MNFSLQQLEYIIALDTYRHYVKAAEKSFVTQPTLSMQVKKLEDQLGVILFDRTKQPIVPTAVGKAVIEQARIILNQAKNLENIVAQEKDTMQGEINLAIIPTLAPYLLPRFVTSLLDKHPELSINVHELLTHEIIDGLKSERLDAGIIVTPLEEKGIMHRVLFYEEIQLYSSKSFDSDWIQFNELSNQKLWLLSKGHCFRNQMVNLCSMPQKGEFLQFNYESGSLETLKKMVDTSGGATLFPELAFMDMPAKDREKLVPIGEEHPYREVSLVYSRSQIKTKQLDLVADEIKNAIPVSMLEQKGMVVEWN